MGLGEGVRWWMGEGEGGPGWGDRAPEGPSVFKTWWLLLINLVVTSNSRILAEGWGSPAAKMMQQNRLLLVTLVPQTVTKTKGDVLPSKNDFKSINQWSRCSAVNYFPTA